MKYDIHYTHKISPTNTDMQRDVELPDGAFANAVTLAKSLRAAGVLMSGDRIREFRVEGDKVVVFPTRGIWHSITIIC